MRLSRFLMRIAIPILCGLPAAGTLTLSAQNQAGILKQQQGPPGTFRIRVRLIPVDVSVTDQRDQPVLDLKREDFQIFENGQLQEIQHFSLQTLSAESPKSGERPVLRGIPTLELAPQPARTFLILLGRGRHQTPLKAVDALIRFVRNDLLPQDRVAVFAYNRATDFSTDHERIAQLLERYTSSNDKIESWLESRVRGLTAIYGIKDIPKSFQREIDKVFMRAAGPAARQVPPGRITEKGNIVVDWDRASEVFLRDTDKAAEADLRKAVADETAETGEPGSKIMQSLIAFDTIGQAFATQGLPFDEFVPRAAGSFQDLQNLFTCVEYLRYMEGEKHLLFFSGDGLMFPNGNVNYSKGLIAIANDARVAIDTFHTGGVFADPEIVPSRGVTLQMAPRGTSTPPAPPQPVLSQASWGRTFMLTTLTDVSKLTGGWSIIGGDVGKALVRLDESTRHTYLLGYYPRDDRWDGKFRQIQVKVGRPGVKLVFRHGYYARDTLRPYNREEFLAYSRITATGGYEADVGDIPFKVTTSLTEKAGSPPQIKVDLQIDPEKVGFKMIEERHATRLYLTIYYADAGGNYLGEDWQTMNLELPEESYQRILRSSIQFSAAIPVKARSQLLKVIVYDTVSDRVGSKLVKTK